MGEPRPSSSSADDGRDTPLGGAAIDALIGWLRRQREIHPVTPLVELVDPTSLPASGLVELAAVDLIGQRRRGRDVIAEDYLQQVPGLADRENDLLDLIDAELCVRRELGERCDAEFFIERFPQLADSIRQLIHLEFRPGEIHRGPATVAPGDSLEWDCSVAQRQMTIAGAPPRGGRPEEELAQDDSIDVPIPIKPPEWMVGARCIATMQLPRGRCWLVKGRDTQHSDTVAMKIIPLPATLGRLQRTRILDICEGTSNVTHPAWGAPRIAAINNGHLAVVRPWVFGNPFGQAAPGSDATQRFSMLVRVAFALAAAHRVGATHGSVTTNNLVVDHRSQVNLIDAASGVAAWSESLAAWDRDLSDTLADRIRGDTIGLVSLITTECLRTRDRQVSRWIRRITDGIPLHDADACAMIGESLQRLIDEPSEERRDEGAWWRKPFRRD
ncbi:hypothetical protein Mal15_57550 [Stieleria maiorica]|uniref:Protein kinase domain-containing protein n=1 Tax=Stieleria maiorica TaxID=2795974 RepID=A0A5B9MP18_9BACT|nr:hypothetical protein [Stieleria maiorica]QEG01677.1 hypothetical protein Mal15_57550 [Stieleria maiorica]